MDPVGNLILFRRYRSLSHFISPGVEVPLPLLNLLTVTRKGLIRSGPSNAPSGHHHLLGLRVGGANESFAGFFISLFSSLFSGHFMIYFLLKLESLLGRRQFFQFLKPHNYAAPLAFSAASQLAPADLWLQTYLPTLCKESLAHTSAPFAG